MLEISLDLNHQLNLFGDVNEIIVTILSCLPLNIQEQIGRRSVMVLNNLENMA